MLIYGKINIIYVLNTKYFPVKVTHSGIMIVKAKKSILNMCLCGIITAAALSITACSSSLTQKALQASAFGPLSLSQAQYAQAYEDADDNQKFDTLILLTRSKIQQGQNESALNDINRLFNTALTQKQRDEATIVYGQYLYAVKNYAKAREELSKVNYRDSLSRTESTYFYNLYANVNNELFKSTKDPKYLLVSFRSLASMIPLADKKKDKVNLINQCVNLLDTLSTSELSGAIASAQNDLDKGFYEYTLIRKSADAELQAQALNGFNQKYKNHPLSLILTAQEQPLENDADQENTAAAAAVNKNSVFSFSDGDTIAVLLPLSGRFAQLVGEPAKLGILTALKDRASNSKVVFFDTNKTNMSEIAAALKNNGTKLIIGPILKPEVTALNNTGNTIPSIAFNQPEGAAASNQWYFDLGPNYEGAIAASKIFADGYKKPVVIGQSSDSASQRAVYSFAKTFNQSGGKAIVCSYNDPNTIKSGLSACSFNDADAVYMNVSGADAVVAKAYVPSSLPVYLTDKSYLGVNNSTLEMSLKGALLGDMPWMLTDSPLKDSFMQTLPKANPQVQRVFAAAYDSVNFAYSIQKLAQNPDDVLHGLSGDISLGNEGLIETSPIWVKLGSLR